MSKNGNGRFLIVLFLLLAPIRGCFTAFDGSSSESHFLTACSQSCPGNLECLCGVCTTVCEDDLSCDRLSSTASCLAAAEVDSCASTGQSPGKTCQVECSEDAQCERLGAEHRCQAGLCLAPEVGTDGEAGSGGAGSGAGGQGGSSGDGETDGVVVGGSGGSNGEAGSVAEFTPEPSVGPKTVNTGMLDILFVIDNSGSMKEEQEKLRQELPRMIRILTSGDMNPDDNGGWIEPGKDFAPATDIHLAVVTVDMGLPGVLMSIDPEMKCTVGLGDDGIFQTVGNLAGDPNLTCIASYPSFLSFQTGQDPNQIANQFQCVTALGTGGCGFEMQLEAPLKALWPANPDNLDESQQALQVIFFGNSPPHGDQQHIEFLRGTSYHPTQSDQMSVLAVVLITDEEDCSAGARGNLDFLEHPNTAPPGIAEQPANLRCYYSRLNDRGDLFPIERFIHGFRALRPGYEQLVVFAAIAGIPPMIMEGDFDANGDGSLNQQERDAFYQAILTDPLMQERIRADGQNLEPSCTLPNIAYDPNDPSSGEFATKAYPARRITGAVRGFGENGVVRSICQQNFTSAVDAIVKAISRHLE